MCRRSLLRKSVESADSEIKSCRLDFHQSPVRAIDVRDRDQHQRDQERQHEHLRLKTKLVHSEERRGSDRNDATRNQNRPEDFRKMLAGLHSPETPVLSQSSQFFHQLVSRYSVRLSMCLALSCKQPKLVDNLGTFWRHLFFFHCCPLMLQGVVCVANAELLNSIRIRILQLAGNTKNIHERIRFLLLVGLCLLRH